MIASLIFPKLSKNMMNATPSYADIQAIVADDFAIMDKQVFGSLNSKVRLIMQVSKHVIDAGGKRMRPLITPSHYPAICPNAKR